jgi:hypothetical protein
MEDYYVFLEYKIYRQHNTAQKTYLLQHLNTVIFLCKNNGIRPVSGVLFRLNHFCIAFVAVLKQEIRLFCTNSKGFCLQPDLA